MSEELGEVRITLAMTWDELNGRVRKWWDENYDSQLWPGLEAAYARFWRMQMVKQGLPDVDIHTVRIVEEPGE